MLLLNNRKSSAYQHNRAWHQILEKRDRQEQLLRMECVCLTEEEWEHYAMYLCSLTVFTFRIVMSEAFEMRIN